MFRHEPQICNYIIRNMDAKFVWNTSNDEMKQYTYIKRG